MRKTTACLLALVAIALLSATIAHAQGRRLSTAPKAFRTFFAGFRDAVRHGEKQKVATMTRFPFKWTFDAGDSGKWSKAQFIKNFDRVFGDGTFGADDPSFSHDGPNYYISTEEASHYCFIKSGTTFKFVELSVEP